MFEDIPWKQKKIDTNWFSYVLKTKINQLKFVIEQKCS